MKYFILLLLLLAFVISAFTQSNSINLNKYLKETEILNYSDSSIQNLVKNRQWKTMDTVERIKAIYNYVRDEIKFGYNISDNITASAILNDGYGQCNTKATMLMTLLRATGIPNRIHGFTINKALQKGAVKGFWYKIAPKNILHSWVEVFVNKKWYFLEGVILDKNYLNQLQKKHKDAEYSFCGYGVYTSNFHQPLIEWDLNHTYIQEKGINQDFGLFDTPDEFYAIHQQKFGFIKKFFYRRIVRHRMNKNVSKIRNPK